MKIWGKLLLFYVFAMLVVGYAFQATYNHFKVEFLNQRTETQKVAYSSVLQSNQILADTFFYEVLNREEILSLIQKIVHSEGEAQRVSRGLLHRSLSATYQRSKKDVAEIFHFQFPDNRSMLRFHNPQKVDDDLTEIRPTIALANRSLHEVHAYESGRSANGYRHVYPLIYHGEHIGSVEISNPYHKIYRKVQQLETALKTQFVFFQKKAGLFEKLFKGQKQYYVPSELHRDFVRYKNIPELLPGQEQREIVSSEIQSLLKNLKADDQVQSKMSQGLAFSQSINQNNKYFSVIFHPVLNISDENSGYLVGITPEPQVQKLVDQFYIYYFLTGIILLAILVYRGTLQSDLLKKKKTEESLQAFFDNKLIGMVYLDAEGFYQQVNRQWEEMTGYRRDELLKMNFRDLTHPDELKQKTLIEELAKSGGRQTFQRTKRYLCKDGSVFWGNLSGTGLYDEHNQFTGMVGIINDITELKTTEEGLRESEERYRTLFETVGVSLWEEDYSEIQIMFERLKQQGITDIPTYIREHPNFVAEAAQALKILEVNAATLKLFHANSKEELLGSLDKVFVPESLPVFCEELVAIAEGRESFEAEAVNGTLDGHQINVLMTVSFPADFKKLGRLTVSITDITELKQVESELAQHRTQLEQRVEERTKELVAKTNQLEKSEQSLTYLLEDVNASRDELQKLNSKYAAINNELKEFAYIVSHDLKAPLRAISQLTHWISEDHAEAFDDEGKMHMDLILQRVKRMDGLIEGILRYSRLGRIREKEEPLDLNILVKEVLDSISLRDNVQINIENKLPVVLRDSTRMEQVFQNLIGNAIKFMDKDKGVINVGCMDEGVAWQFSVSDNGPGIDEKYHDKIFQIFQTLAPRDEHESTGIGLALVKKIIGLYGGSIWVESEVDRGTTFYFTLPKKEKMDEKL